MVQRLMLVEDDEDDRDFFVNIVEDLYPQITCQTTRNGREALDTLIAQESQPDVIFLDLNMPLMNGKQFLAEIKKNEALSDIPVVILSTSSDQLSIRETTELGAFHFMTKPDKVSAWKENLRVFFEKYQSR